jgi:hypothetical protein
MSAPVKFGMPISYGTAIKISDACQRPVNAKGGKR